MCYQIFGSLNNYNNKVNFVLHVTKQFFVVLYIGYMVLSETSPSVYAWKLEQSISSCQLFFIEHIYFILYFTFFILLLLEFFKILCPLLNKLVGVCNHLATSVGMILHQTKFNLPVNYASRCHLQQPTQLCLVPYKPVSGKKYDYVHEG